MSTFDNLKLYAVAPVRLASSALFHSPANILWQVAICGLPFSVLELTRQTEVYTIVVLRTTALFSQRLPMIYRVYVYISVCLYLNSRGRGGIGDDVFSYRKIAVCCTLQSGLEQVFGGYVYHWQSVTANVLKSNAVMTDDAWYLSAINRNVLLRRVN